MVCKQITHRLLIHSRLFAQPDRDAAPGLFRSILGKGKGNRTNSDDTVDQRATSKSRRDARALASSVAEFTLRGVKEASDAFPPLKSAAAALCFILDNCQVLSTLYIPSIQDTYVFPRKQWRVAERLSRLFPASRN